MERPIVLLIPGNKGNGYSVFNFSKCILVFYHISKQFTNFYTLDRHYDEITKSSEVFKMLCQFCKNMVEYNYKAKFQVKELAFRVD